MERTTDILATVAASPERPRFVVGFAAETESVEQNARTKLLKKNLDMIAANEVGDAKAFECEDNHLIVLCAHGAARPRPGDKIGPRRTAHRAHRRSARRARSHAPARHRHGQA